MNQIMRNAGFAVLLAAFNAQPSWAQSTAGTVVATGGGASGPPPPQPGPSSSSLHVLDERYARGEINREEYLQKKQDILAASAPFQNKS